MSLANQAPAVTPLLLLACQSAANTAAATSAFVAVSGYEGIVSVLIAVGAITGTIDFTFETATDTGGTGNVAIVPLGGALAQVTTSNDVAVYIAHFDTRALKGALKVIGTIVTGPALVSYTLLGRKKTV